MPRSQKDTAFSISTIGVFHLLPASSNRRRLGYRVAPPKHNGSPQKYSFVFMVYILYLQKTLKEANNKRHRFNGCVGKRKKGQEFRSHGKRPERPQEIGAKMC